MATNARRAAKRAAAALGRDWQPADPALAARRTALIDPEDYSHPMSDVRVGP